jgi:hypothetical protein
MHPPMDRRSGHRVLALVVSKADWLAALSPCEVNVTLVSVSPVRASTTSTGQPPVPVHPPPMARQKPAGSPASIAAGGDIESIGINGCSPSAYSTRRRRGRRRRHPQPGLRRVIDRVGRRNRCSSEVVGSSRGKATAARSSRRPARLAGISTAPALALLPAAQPCRSGCIQSAAARASAVCSRAVLVSVGSHHLRSWVARLGQGITGPQTHPLPPRSSLPINDIMASRSAHADRPYIRPAHFWHLASKVTDGQRAGRDRSSAGDWLSQRRLPSDIS